jgi:hypothetical protein
MSERAKGEVMRTWAVTLVGVLILVACNTTPGLMGDSPRVESVTPSTSASAAARCEPPCLWQLWRTWEDRWVWVRSFHTAADCERVVRRMAERPNQQVRYQCRPETEIQKAIPL